MDFLVSIDLFVSAVPKEVREVFRRMNSYTVPLNPEEHRHSVFQGRFKWFIHRLARRFDEAFVRMGLFGQKQLVRMADTKLLAEISHAFSHGIQTTNAKMLDRLYEDKDESFPQENALDARITNALDELGEWAELHQGSLMKPYIVYALTLAMAHMRDPVPQLVELYPSPALAEFDRPTALTNLSVLSAALEDPDNAGRFREFVEACSSRTNVKDQRMRRFTWLCRALSAESL